MADLPTVTHEFNNADDLTKTVVTAGDFSLAVASNRLQLGGEGVGAEFDNSEEYYEINDIELGFQYNSADYEIYFVGKATSANWSNGGEYQLGIRLVYDDGTEYEVALRSDDGTEQSEAGAWHNLSGVGSFQDTESSDFKWIKVVVEVSGTNRTFKLYKVNKASKPQNFTELISENYGTVLSTLTYSGGKTNYPTAFQIYGYAVKGVGTALDLDPFEVTLDFLHFSGSPAYIDTFVDAGEIGYDIVQSINSFSTGKIVVNNKNFADQATLESNILTTLVKQEEKYGNTIFRGEARKMLTAYNMVEYQAKSKAQKMLNQRSNYDPVKASGFMRYLGYDSGTFYLDDINQAFGTSGELDNHLFHWQRSSPNRMFQSPNDHSSVSPTIRLYADGAADEYKIDNGTTTDAIQNESDIRNLYFSLPDGQENVDDNTYISYRAYNSTLSSEAWYIRLDIYFSLKSGISVASIDEIAVEGSWRRLFALQTNTGQPFIGIYDSSNTRYEGDYITGSDVGSIFVYNDDSSSGLKVTPIIVKKLNEDNVSGLSTPANYIDTVSTDGSWTLYRMRLMLASGKANNLKKIIKLREIRLKMTLDGNLYPDSGISTIASHTDQTLTFGTLSGGQEPLFDGAGQSDVYLITDTLTNQITDIASNWGVTINADITDSDLMALTSDHTYSKRYDTLQEICNISNSVWWYDDGADAYNIVSADKLDGSDLTYQSGVTITRDDIVGWFDGAWSYEIDADNIRDTIVVKGSKNIGDTSVSTTPEFSHTTGSEQVIINASGIPSPAQLKDFANSEKHKYENARRKAVFTLDYDKPNQDYSNLAVGSTIGLQLPSSSDTSICNHTVGNDGELLITNMQWTRREENGMRESVTITAERRYS